MKHLIPATVSQQGSRMMKRIEVVAAIIHDAEGRIFATQRGYGEWKDGWEFPGGKMEAGETPEEALRREIWEELELKEHEAARWLAKEELGSVDWLPADLQITDKLKNYL